MTYFKLWGNLGVLFHSHQVRRESHWSVSTIHSGVKCQNRQERSVWTWFKNTLADEFSPSTCTFFVLPDFVAPFMCRWHYVELHSSSHQVWKLGNFHFLNLHFGSSIFCEWFNTPHASHDVYPSATSNNTSAHFLLPHSILIINSKLLVTFS